MRWPKEFTYRDGFLECLAGTQYWALFVTRERMACRVTILVGVMLGVSFSDWALGCRSNVAELREGREPDSCAGVQESPFCCGGMHENSEVW